MGDKSFIRLEIRVKPKRWEMCNYKEEKIRPRCGNVLICVREVLICI